MSDNSNPAMGFFNSMPDWLKALVMMMVAPFLALAIAGLVLQVNVNEYLDQYFDMQMLAMQRGLDGMSGEVTAMIDEHFAQLEDRVAQTEFMALDHSKRIELLEAWACDHKDTQGLTGVDAPTWCSE